MQLISARGYEATTLRDIAKEAGVSQQAVVIALYDERSSEYARPCADGPRREQLRRRAQAPHSTPVGPLSDGIPRRCAGVPEPASGRQ